ncbi:hypothetical protein PILCRDRAFT_295692 [Piloderma croceum F 1598]|uniref:Uncharacterized protein n=1 Tax=Piloderma croceum (strain F 1598) TaxID=765440 RepID=A0A0C3FS96_PILCF|nr:hypothetical protein PILCRDRAFT_295692 [Piloderma croceum F 1598]
MTAKITIRTCSPHAFSKPPMATRLVNNPGESTCKDAIVVRSWSPKMRTEGSKVPKGKRKKLKNDWIAVWVNINQRELGAGMNKKNLLVIYTHYTSVCDNLECSPHVNLSQRLDTSVLSPNGEVAERGKNKDGITNK